MKSILRAGAIGVPAAALFVQLVLACATTDDAGPTGPADDGGTPLLDGEPPPEASVDADAEAGPPPRECSDDGFCHTTLPKNQELHGVWGDGQGTVWAVSSQGAILRFGANAWTVHASNLGKLTAVWGSSPTDVWVGGEDGLFHGTGTSPETLTFTRTTTPTGEVSSIWGQNANDVWATLVLPEGSSRRSRVLHYSAGDGGPSWSLVSIGSTETLFTHVWGSAGTGVWLAGTNFNPDEYVELGAVYHRLPGASAFTEVALPGHPEFSGAFWSFGKVQSTSMIGDASMVIQGALASGDAVFVRGTSADGGKTFTFATELDGTFEDPTTNAITAFADDDLWTAGYGRIRHWDGVEWTPAAVTITKYPVIAPFYGIWTKGLNDFWVVGENIALHYDPTRKR